MVSEVATGVRLGALSHELPYVPFQSAFDEANVNMCFIVAGRDSTSSVLVCFIYYLVSKPEVAEKIYDELCAFEARHQRTPTLNSGKYAYITIDNIHEFVTVFTVFKSKLSPVSHSSASITVRQFGENDLPSILQSRNNFFALKSKKVELC
ncbi:protein MpCYP704-like10 [Marchantia polymorpha subsp. ruderalis]|uniref:Uncharacterized protein n=2 Tax=Marchantia polymorpha TaxID=3197 RepID=A0AAF6B557_MARPO|nr:hypothetical protein MARPO_0066s0006 [Marchantia polymorpha]BBN07141.1 hypothetical protein Mp_4g01370 [Marchantia polymorpha subsp. ruderalis]|eukprot:PTQ36043.1 hypothetical protein MARPO_0066s0006 [Marchantia polymorpha]